MKEYKKLRARWDPSEKQDLEAYDLMNNKKTTDNNGVREEGHWYTEYTPEYPMPVVDELTKEEAASIYLLMLKKEDEASIESYKGFSFSRITGEGLGNKAYILDGWEWPEDFGSHYVRDHRVRPSKDFLEFIGYKKELPSTNNEYIIRHERKVDPMEVLIGQMSSQIAEDIDKEILDEMIKMGDKDGDFK